MRGMYGDTGKYIMQWLGFDEAFSLCYTNENNNIVAFALLSKMDFDPEKIHKKPFSLNYIYTQNPYRRMGYSRAH